MKFIQSITHRLFLAEDRIKALKKENRELRIEVARITGQKTRLPKAKVSSSTDRDRPSTSESSLPSYARSTMTSRLRRTPSTASSSRSTPSSTDLSSTPPTSPKHVGVDGTRYDYKDGKPELARLRGRVSWSNGEIGHLHSTIAARNRVRVSVPWRTRQRPTTPNSQTTSEESGWGHSTDESSDMDCSEDGDEREEPGRGHSRDESSHMDCSEDDGEREDPKPAETAQIMPQKESDDDTGVTQQGIASRTRLADASWSRAWAYAVHIDHDALFDILSQTEALAKRCLWGWMHTHRPDECWRWVGYPSNIDFGRERLQGFLDHLPSGFFKFRFTDSWEVKNRLRGLIPFRNFLHHFCGWHKVCHVDPYIEDVQKLAVLLYDEESAMRARELRDRLREEAERTLQEADTFMMWASLPSPEAGVTWKPHHEGTVQDVSREFSMASWMYSDPATMYTAS